MCVSVPNEAWEISGISHTNADHVLRPDEAILCEEHLSVAQIADDGDRNGSRGNPEAEMGFGRGQKVGDMTKGVAEALPPSLRR